MLVINDPNDINRFLSNLSGKYRRSRRELFGATILFMIVFFGGIVLIAASVQNIQSGNRLTGLLLLLLSLTGLALPIYFVYTLKQQTYDISPEQIIACSGQHTTWTVEVGNVQYIMFHSGTAGVKEFVFQPQRGKARTIACTDSLQKRIADVLQHWQ